VSVAVPAVGVAEGGDVAGEDATAGVSAAALVSAARSAAGEHALTPALQSAQTHTALDVAKRRIRIIPSGRE